MSTEQEIRIRYEHLKEFCQLTWDDGALFRLDTAFEFAREILGEQKFPHNEVILNHSLDVASIIAMEIGLESISTQ